MSSDTFYVHVQSIVGDTVELLCAASTAGGINDYAVTRSFALMAIEDGMPYPSESMTPLQARMREVGGQTPPVWEREFHRQHVGTFIASTELVERRNIITDESAWTQGRFDPANKAVAERLYPFHQFVLRVRVTDPRWLEGLPVGARYGTTAFDPWWDDPLRPSNARLVAVERAASRWHPPGTKTKRATPQAAARKTATKQASAKRGIKKAATKKTATKQAPAKEAAKTTAARKTAKKQSAGKTATKQGARKTAKKQAAKEAATKQGARKTDTKQGGKKTATKQGARKTDTEQAAKKAATKQGGKKAATKQAARKTAKKAVTHKAPW